MPREIQIGNGSVLLAYDRRGLIRDFYFPNAGMENHAQGHPVRVGVYANGLFSRVGAESWLPRLDYEDDTLVALIALTNHRLGVELTFRDVVDFHENLFVREIRARNLSGSPIELRLFFHHDFHIYGSEIGDTACFKPEVSGLLHYKGCRYFLINAEHGRETGILRYATGTKEAKGLMGTWVDAEDGELSGNPIAQGAVDSVFAMHAPLEPGGEFASHYWIACAEDWKGAYRLNSLVKERSPGYIIKRTADYWRLWCGKEKINFDGLPESVARLYRRSLLILRTNINDNGATIAAADSDIQHYYKDTYTYTWPRDGALVAHSLGMAGYPIPARNFFTFCANVISRSGYFLHKYNCNGSAASSWHPWVINGQPSLPIQEDETGLVVWALWEHFKIYRDIEFIKPFYRRLVKAAADFMCSFVDPETGLPMPSYDLWEERLGVHTFTTSAVIAGLKAAANFTEAFGEAELSSKYRFVADKMTAALAKFMYDTEKKHFARTLLRDGTLDNTLDISLSSLVVFDVLPATDERVISTMEAMKNTLWCQTEIGGMARYEHDTYQAVVPPSREVPGNPWIKSALWYAQYLIARAADTEELKAAIPFMEWVASRVLPSGVIPEQINPVTGEPVSVSPLTWSHAEFVITVQKYLDKLGTIGVCPMCHRPIFFKHRMNT